MKITKFTNKNVSSIEDQIVAACNAAGITGVSFSGATRSYGATETTFKITANIAGTTSRVDAAFESACKRDGIDVNVKGKKGQKLIGYRPRATAHPYIYETVRGAQYIGSANRWKSLL